MLRIEVIMQLVDKNPLRILNNLGFGDEFCNWFNNTDYVINDLFQMRFFVAFKFLKETHPGHAITRQFNRLSKWRPEQFPHTEQELEYYIAKNESIQ